MAENPVFDAIVRAVDHATGPIKAITASVTQLGHAAEVAGHHTEHMEHARMFEALGGHVTLLRGHFGELNAGIGEVGHSITEFLPALAALGAAGSLVGLVEMVEHVSEAQAALAAMATRIGIATRELATMNTVAQLTDVSVEKMQRGLLLLERGVAQAASGGNKSLTALFHHLNLGLKDASGHIKPVTELMPELAEAFKKTTDPAIRVRAAMALFGKSGTDLLPMLVLGRDGLKEMSEAAEKVNFVPDKEGMEGLEETHRAFVLLTTAAQGFETAVATKLAPILRPVLEEVTEWVTANRDWVATSIAEKVGELATWIGKLHIHDTVETMKEFAAAAMGAVHSVGGLNVMIGAAVLLLGSPILSAITAIIEIMGTFKELLVGIGELLWANPILAAIGIVSIAVYELYEHWAPVKVWFWDVWHRVTEAFDWAWPKIKAALTGIGLLVAPFLAAFAPITLPLTAFGAAAYEVWAHWDWIQPKFEAMWHAIVAAFEWAWERIKPIADFIGAAADALAEKLSFSTDIQLNVARGAVSPDLGLFGLDNAPRNDIGVSRGPNRFEALPSLYAAPDSSAADDPNSRVHVQVDLRNLPPGSQVRTSSQGLTRPPSTSVGYSDPLAVGY